MRLSVDLYTVSFLDCCPSSVSSFLHFLFKDISDCPGQVVAEPVVGDILGTVSTAGRNGGLSFAQCGLGATNSTSA